MRNYWVIADTHFGHGKLVEKGFRPNGFEEIIFRKLKVVDKGDVLIHLGDFCWRNDEHWLELFQGVRGKKWLVRGNHDKKSNFYYLEHGFDFVVDEIGMDIFGKRILFTHAPTNIYGYDLNIHGHLHDFSGKRMEESKNVLTNKHILVKMDHEYKPVTLKTILKWM